MERPIDVLRMVLARPLVEALAQRIPSEDARRLTALLCPEEALQKAGLLDEHAQRTPAWEAAHAEACERLPRELAQEEKLRFVSSIFESIVRDGHLEREESAVLLSAATCLGLSSSELDALLDGFTEHVGQIDLDLPEEEPLSH